jgi:hypothetical protein
MSEPLGHAISIAGVAALLFTASIAMPGRRLFRPVSPVSDGADGG